MYEPYVPPAEDSDPGTPCRCVAEGVPCPWDCDRCPVDCPEREAVSQPVAEPVAQPVAERSSYRTHRSRRRRTYTSTSSASSSASSSSGGSSWRSSRSSGGSSGRSGRSGTSKKAGAGIGAAATAAAGGFGALSSGNDDTPDPTPDYSYHAESDTDPYQYGSDQYGSDPYAVVDRATAPVVSFRTRKDGRLVVVTGSWRDVDLAGTCEVEVTVTERAHRVIIEAGTDLTRLDVDRGETCPAPDTWATERTVLVLDEPVGDRQVVTSGPLLEGGLPVDPPGLVPVPRAD